MSVFSWLDTVHVDQIYTYVHICGHHCTHISEGVNGYVTLYNCGHRYVHNDFYGIVGLLSHLDDDGWNIEHVPLSYYG